MKPFFPSILPPEPIRKAPTVRELGRAPQLLIAEYGLGAHKIIYSAMLADGEELFVRQEKNEFVFEARKETP